MTRRRIGLFLSSASCGEDSFIDVDALCEHFVLLVSHCSVVVDFHQPECQSQILRTLARKKLNAVVLVGESQEAYRILLGTGSFLSEIEDAGVNPNHLGFVPIREHCVLAHLEASPQERFDRAVALTDATLSALKTKEPLRVVEVAPYRRVLVIGSGAAAVTAAYRLLENNLRVTLVDRGASWRWNELEAVELKAAAARVLRDPKGQVRLSTRVGAIQGWTGDFDVTFESEDGSVIEKHGGIVVAVNGDYAEYASLWPLLRIDCNHDGMPLPRNPHTLSIHSGTEGVVVVRRASRRASLSAQLQQQSIHGTAAALEVANVLWRPFLTHPVTVSRVKPEDCGLCRTCIKVCAFGACTINERTRTSQVDERRCRGCGNCVVACPAGARDLLTERTDHISAAIHIFGEAAWKKQPSVLAFLCAGCAGRAAEEGVRAGYTYPENVWPIRVACGGRVDMQHVLQAFVEGFDGVVIGTCRENRCHNIVGHGYLDRRVIPMREVLRSRRFDPDRLLVVKVNPNEGRLCNATLTGFFEALRQTSAGGPPIDLRLAITAHLRRVLDEENGTAGFVGQETTRSGLTLGNDYGTVRAWDDPDRWLE